MIFIKFKRYIALLLIFVSVLSVSSLADGYTATDRVYLQNVSTQCNSIEAMVYTYMPALYADFNLLLASNGWLANIRDDTQKMKNSLDRIDKNIYPTIVNSLSSVQSSLSDILSLLNGNEDKQEDALSDYSSSGGRSASDTSSDVGAISGSLSNSFNSGVSASSALNAVDDNQSDFQYFFFGMTNDLNTSGGGSSSAPARGSKSIDFGSQVPDFLSDYWGGLND